MTDALEADRVAVEGFQDGTFPSRFGLLVDWRVDPEADSAISNAKRLIHGMRSIPEIAARLDGSRDIVKNPVDGFHRHGLVRHL